MLKTAFLEKSSKVNSIEEYLAFVSEPDRDGEMHHVLPKCLFPEFKNLSKHPWNGVVLSPSRHLIAHRILTEIFPKETKLVQAFNLMSGRMGMRERVSLHWVHNETDKRLVTRLVKDELEKLGWSPGRGRLRPETVDLMRKNHSQKKGETALVHKEGTTLRVRVSELENYFSRGWERGLKKETRALLAGRDNPKRKLIHKGVVTKRVLLNEVDSFLEEGWLLGGRPGVDTEETRKLKSEGKIGELNPAKGKVFIHHPEFGRRLVLPEEVSPLLLSGWLLGMGERKS